MRTCEWLEVNGYGEWAAVIRDIEATLAARGSKQRRNWWDVLAGGKDGAPLKVEGHLFPVLAAAQVRPGRSVTPNAIRINPDEVAGPPRQSRRGQETPTP